jgi:NAD-reducing hydrogenase large subunit
VTTPPDSPPEGVVGLYPTLQKQNNLAMNRTMAQIAKHYVRSPQIPEGVLNRLEAGIRAFDPCLSLSCSTHAVGSMPLHVQLIAADGTIMGEAWRD